MLYEETYEFPKWQVTMLTLAGIYNFMWGILVVFFPEMVFTRFGLEIPSHLFFWQSIGMIAGILGIGYLITSANPIRYWPVILIGFLVKTSATIGFAWKYFIQGIVPVEIGYVTIISAAIWILPFGAMLREVYRHWVYEIRPLEEELFLEHHFNEVKTNQGENLQEMSQKWPVVLVFLRHFGCTFCREMLTDLSNLRDDIERSGKAMVIVHMNETEDADNFIRNFGLRNVHHISDQDRKLYRYFGLRRGFFGQIFGLKNFYRFFSAGLKDGHGMGKAEGDAWQMPGIFIYYKGKIKQKFIHKSAADRPNYQELIEFDPEVKNVS